MQACKYTDQREKKTRIKIQVYCGVIHRVY